MDLPDNKTLIPQVETRFESEDSRTHHYLASQTAGPINQILQDHLLTPHVPTVIALPNSGLDAMIDFDKMDDLSRLYRIYTIVPTGLPTLKRSIKESVARRGQQINQVSQGIDGDNVDVDDVEAETPKGKGKEKARQNAGAQTLTLALRWVQDVLDLKDKFDRVWRDAFQRDRELESTLNEVIVTSRSFRQTYLTLLLSQGLRIIYQP